MRLQTDVKALRRRTASGPESRSRGSCEEARQTVEGAKGYMKGERCGGG